MTLVGVAVVGATLALLMSFQASASPQASNQICAQQGNGRQFNDVWRAHMRKAVAYARARGGDISFAVRTAHRFYGFRADHQVPSVSVIKAMFMVAYLDLASVRHRALNAYDLSLLTPMITRSDNDAATRVRDIIGAGSLYALAARAHMTRFQADPGPIWGNSLITARDQTTFFLSLERYVAARHRRTALHLLASITPSQRWGIGRVPRHGWKLYFKGGWGSGTGAADHQVALLARGCARVAVAVMTLGSPSHAYGKETLRGIFTRLLQKLPTTIGLDVHHASVRILPAG